MIFASRCANILWQSDALLAQLDRVFGYEPKGQGFESLAARQVKSLEPQRVQGFFLFIFMFESGQKFTLWSLFGLYGLQNRAFRCASGSGVGNALKSHFRRFCREKVRRRRVTGKGSNFFITPISYKHEKNISLQVTQSNVTCNVTCNADVTPCNAVEEDIDKDIEEDIKEIDKEKPTRHKYDEYQNVLLTDLHNGNLAQKNAPCSLSMTCH